MFTAPGDDASALAERIKIIVNNRSANAPRSQQKRLGIRPTQTLILGQASLELQFTLGLPMPSRMFMTAKKTNSILSNTASKLPRNLAALAIYSTSKKRWSLITNASELLQ